MTQTNATKIRAFNSLNAIYDTLDGTDIRADLMEAGYSEEIVNVTQDNINRMMGNLEDILPGLEMNIMVEDYNKNK